MIQIRKGRDGRSGLTVLRAHAKAIYGLLRHRVPMALKIAWEFRSD